jgi:hypothetical protein
MQRRFATVPTRCQFHALMLIRLELLFSVPPPQRKVWKPKPGRQPQARGEPAK